MVPWHLQPKYSLQQAPLSCLRKKPKRASRSSKKKKKKMKNNELVDIGAATGEVMLVVSEGERLLGPLEDLQLDDEDFCLSRDEGKTESESCSVPQSKGTPSKRRNTDKDMADVKENSELGEVPELVLETELPELGYSTFQRYYHVFRQGELACLVQGIPGVEVKLDYFDHENWCVLAMKTAVNG